MPSPASELASAPASSTALQPQKFVVARGGGLSAQAGDRVEMNYRCFEIGGTYEFDSRATGRAPVLTAGKAWPREFGQALIGARRGDRLLILVPDAYLDFPERAGEVGLDPGTDLLFEVSVTDINPEPTSGKSASRQADAAHGGPKTW
jgi:FKBP-type peptidyl-prolyl cis-trans isomerase